MNKRLLSVAVLTLVLLNGCSAKKSSKSLQFTATWQETFAADSPPSPQGAQLIKKVTASNNFFKIVQVSQGVENEIRIYDGQKFFQKGGLGGENGSTESATEHSVSYMRFWRIPGWTPQVAGSVGEPVVGRETILYEEKEPISNTIFRRWLDKETRILLKEEQRKGEDNSVKFVRECQEINFGEPAQDAFNIP